MRQLTTQAKSNERYMSASKNFHILAVKATYSPKLHFQVANRLGTYCRLGARSSLYFILTQFQPMFQFKPPENIRKPVAF